jgi:hypothetical protein
MIPPDLLYPFGSQPGKKVFMKMIEIEYPVPDEMLKKLFFLKLFRKTGRFASIQCEQDFQFS